MNKSVVFQVNTSNKKLKHKLNIPKKVLISIIFILGLALTIYQILFILSSVKHFKLELIALIRLLSIVLFLFIPLFLLVIRKLSFSTFIYFLIFETSFDVTMQSLYLWMSGG